MRNWASGRFARTAMTYWKQAIEYTNLGHFGKRYVPGSRSTSGSWRTVWNKRARIEARIVMQQSHTGTQRGGKDVYKGDDR